ncbi:MAG: VPLPA-CTERM sorting domain-containing protein [Pseudomonadota bacterium]
MKHLIKFAAVIAVALTFTQNAQAQAYPDPATGDGGALIVSIWDTQLGVSLVYAIPGVFYQDLVDGTFGQTNFETAIPQFSTIFSESDSANLLYQVTATGPDAINGRGALYTTGGDTLPSVTSGNIAGTFQNSQAFYFQLDSTCGADPVCPAANSQAGTFAGSATWGDLTAQLPFSAATGVGFALNFYSLTQNTASRIRPTDPAEVGPAAPGASWFLSADGLLSYTVVPVPAAIWMLISGLLGFGAISRRKQAA